MKSDIDTVSCIRYTVYSIMFSTIAKPKPKKQRKFSRFTFKKRVLITIVLCFLSYFLFQIIRLTFFYPQVLGVSVTLNSAEIIALVNQERQKQNLPALKPNEKLDRAAQAKLSNMFVYQYWDHLSPSQTPPWTFILNAGYDYAYAGENLARDFVDNAKLVESWMNSPEHKANIMSPYYQDTSVIFGSGTIDGQETVLIIQMFGKAYTDQDYIDAGVNPPRQFSDQSQSLVSQKNFNSNLWLLFSTFFDFKILVFFLIGFTCGFILFEAIRRIRLKQKYLLTLDQMKRKYWGRV